LEGGVVRTVEVEKDQSPPSKMDELMKAFAPLAVRNEWDYRRIVKWIDKLAVLDKRTRDQDRFLETLTLLAEAYEDKRHQIDVTRRTPLEVLKFLMEQHEMSGRELGRMLGQAQLGGKILRGERELSKAHIRRLCDYFKVRAELFL
jgi:HTH-type transcriptional regulator/antitoxin HigA